MASLLMYQVVYDVNVRTINYHLKKIFEDVELEQHSVIQDFRITALISGQVQRANDYSPLRIWTLPDNILNNDFPRNG